VRTPALAREQDFFVKPKRGVGIVEVRRGYSTLSAAQVGLGVGESGVWAGAHSSSPTWKEHEGGCFSVVCHGRIDSMS